MGCEQLVQHAKVSKNRKFIPHFRENLARPLDKGGVGVVYLPCNSQSAASVRKVINTVNRLIHRVTAEVINPFQQLSTLYRHVVDTSPLPSGAPPLRFTAEPQHCRPVSRCTAHRSTAHRCTVLFASLRRFPAVPQHCRPAFPLYRFSVVPKLLCLFPTLTRHRFTAAPLLRFTSVRRHCSTGLPFAALPLRRFAVYGPFCSKTLSCSLFFPFSGTPLSPFREVCLPGVGSGRLPGGLGNGAPDAAATPSLRTRNPVPHLGSDDSTPGGRITAPAALPHRNAGWRGGVPEGLRCRRVEERRK